MGERGDIIRTMQRAYAARGNAPALVDQIIYDPAAPDARPLIGRVVERGLSDEYADRHYVIVEAIDGRSHYAEIGKGEAVEPIRSEEHTSELQSLMRISYAVFCLKKQQTRRYN